MWKIYILETSRKSVISLEQTLKGENDMSIGIATMGLFRDCCGGAPGGGGAPPYRQNASEMIKPRVIVNKVEMETKNSLEDYLDKIKVKLVSFEGD